MKFHRLSSTVACLAVFFVACHTVGCQETNEGGDWYSNLALVIHRNGEADPCGATEAGSIDSGFVETLTTAGDKYEMETRLTDGIAKMLDDAPSASRCGREDEKEKLNPDFHKLYRHCDRGRKKTPILLDHEKLVRTTTDKLPCRFYTREGLRIQNLEQLKTMAEKARTAPAQSCANPQEGDDGLKSCEAPEVHLYAVPAGRVFHFAPAFVGETFELDHLKLLPDASKPIVLKVLATSPKVFDILHVFTPEEAASIVERALAETSPTHKMKRSTTGAGSASSVFSKRTSDNGFDTHGKVALAIKKRIFEVLGYDEYWDGHDDGLQVLRYNLTQAYVPHMDYLPVSTKTAFDYNSPRKGGNRYATVLLYMTDIEEGDGGETVFSKIWPEGEQKSEEDALAELRASGDAERAGIEEESWEELMVATCRSKFSVRPRAGRAVLFYSQLPDGREDPMSLHGGCPVLKGDKWAANLWVWNTPRESFEGAPKREDMTSEERKRLEESSRQTAKQITASFINSGNDPAMKNAMLYYDEAQFWGNFGHDDPQLGANTFEGHRWNVKVDGQVVKTWVISAEQQQEFII